MSWAAWGGASPLDWYRLIGDAEEFRQRTGWGLGGLWGLINQQKYESARARMDELLAIPDPPRRTRQLTT
ncbi:hypothetical protein ATM97_16985 [Nocardia sp. MH4]|uniref:hypothetical protein n=1 Tax=Nocardia sp. MH4 TaxID=1768677 RepID=UPI001C501E62|nr:hypothetical protein [Nocardia sp. MH4]MBW0274304.1 hypothetical protein [Nocardia sp. MH4]